MKGQRKKKKDLWTDKQTYGRIVESYLSYTQSCISQFSIYLQYVKEDLSDGIDILALMHGHRLYENRLS